MKLILGVSADSSESNSAAMEAAYRLGRLLGSQKQIIVICGGRTGAMRALAQGIKSSGGSCIGILPGSKSEANPYVDYPLPTGIGFARNFLLVNMADLIVGIGGGWGTLSEISYALCIGKPVILIEGTGGWTDLLAKHSEKFHPRPEVVSSPEQALELILERLRSMPHDNKLNSNPSSKI